MYRKALSNIEEWIHSDDRHVLLVTGARQIGKTYIIREALNKNSCNYVELNFIENVDLKSIFENYKDAKDIEMRLSLATQKELIPGKTIIFLDEIQELSDMITMAKFLVEETNYRFIMSGSLLGVAIKDLRSAPVGYMHILDMYPMDLEEFYIALNVSENILSNLKDNFDERKSIDDFVHQQLLRLFNIYLIVGGMPEAVKEYVKTNDLRKVSVIQKNIINLYKADFSKYNNKEKLILNEIYDAIPGELGEKNKRFYVNHIGGKDSFDKVKNNFVWLQNAGVALPVYNVTEPKAPLIMSEKRNLFKLFLSDVGLLTSHFADDIKIKIINNSKAVNNGSVYENFVAQELIAHGYNVYYFNSKKQGEIDFLIERNGNVLPIEVKSGKDFKKHSALNNLLQNDEYDIRESFIMSNNNLEVIEKRTYLPIYMTMFISEDMLDMHYKIDLAGLI